MTEKEEQLGHLSEIKNMMEKSSRFLSYKFAEIVEIDNPSIWSRS